MKSCGVGPYFVPAPALLPTRPLHWSMAVL